MTLTLNGIQVYRVGDSIFMPLPRELWRESGFPGRCSCGKCDGSGMWDTLAIAAKPTKDDRTRTVHFPGLHTVDASREAREAQAILDRVKARES